MSIVRLAIVGAGVIGRRHAAAIADDPAAKLVAITDPAPASAEFAKQAGTAFYETVEALFASEQIDGAIIATPTEHHFQPTLTALEAGAHALVEKPIMATLEEAKAITDKTEATGLHVLVGHHRRYYPQVHVAREIIQSGELGQLVAVSGQWNVRKNDEYFAPDWRKKKEAGPVLTNLIHEIDYLRYICGEIETVSAEVANGVMETEKEDAAAMVMRFANGALGTFILSDQTPSPWAWEFATGENPAFPQSSQNAIRFMGTKTALDFPNLVLWHHGDEAPDWNHAIKSETHPHNLTDAYVSQIAHFCAVIEGREHPRISARDATKSLAATLAVFDAASTGQRIVL